MFGRFDVIFPYPSKDLGTQRIDPMNIYISSYQYAYGHLGLAHFAVGVCICCQELESKVNSMVST